VGGGIGMAASANLNPSGAFPSMFEPVHGSAPDIAGKGVADPTAAIMSMVLLLEHHGFLAEAQKIRSAVVSDVATRAAAGPPRSTAEVGHAIRAQL
jgi:3-isopropylmalate dehydrogenase